VAEYSSLELGFGYGRPTLHIVGKEDEAAAATPAFFLTLDEPAQQSYLTIY
jgi:hypothetical protein